MTTSQNSTNALTSPIPVKNSTEPFWYSTKHHLHDYRSTGSLPDNEVIDVIIIGAGYAGVATAYNLVKDDTAKHCPKLSVMILEARSACSGATGRNGTAQDTHYFNKNILTIHRWAPSPRPLWPHSDLHQTCWSQCWC